MSRPKPIAVDTADAIRIANQAYNTLTGYLRLERIAEAYDLTEEVDRITAGVAASEARVDEAILAALMAGATLASIATLAPDAMARAQRVFPPKTSR